MLPFILIGMINNFRINHLLFIWPIECTGYDAFSALIVNCIIIPFVIAITIGSIKYQRLGGKFWKACIYHVLIMVYIILSHNIGMGLFLIEDKRQSFYYEDRYFDYPCKDANLVYGHHTFGLGVLITVIVSSIIAGSSMIVFRVIHLF